MEIIMYYEKILKRLKIYLEVAKKPLHEKLFKVCTILHDNIEKYDWVGFYFLKNSKLELGPFVGEPTEHISIDIGEGICGQAAKTQRIFIVDDVSKETNYLACSPKVKSEIVIPIMKNGKILGELDIDSHEINGFNAKDKNFLEKLVEILILYL